MFCVKKFYSYACFLVWDFIFFSLIIMNLFALLTDNKYVLIRFHGLKKRLILIFNRSISERSTNLLEFDHCKQKKILSQCFKYTFYHFLWYNFILHLQLFVLLEESMHIFIIKWWKHIILEGICIQLWKQQHLCLHIKP